MDALDPKYYFDRLSGHIRECNRRYPRAWEEFEHFRAGRGKLGDWPNWCYCPLAGAHVIVRDPRRGKLAGIQGGESDPLIDSPAADIARLGALSAWRMTQGVYAIDPTILQALVETPVNGVIPIEVLLRLPQWCLYVPLPGIDLREQAVGFFAWLEHDANDRTTELRLLIDRGSLPPYLGLRSELLPLKPGSTIKDSHDALFASAVQRSWDLGVVPRGLPEDRERLFASRVKTISPLLSILLYLCSQTAQYEPQTGTATLPSNPEPTKIKGGWRLFPPDRPKIWTVGRKLGKAIREAEAAERIQGERSSPRPHVRRAHWHGYWLGPRSGERRFELRWLPPIPVALADDELPANELGD